MVFNTVGGDTYKKSFEVLKENGSVISVVEQPNTELMSAFNVKATFVMGMATTERLNKFTKVFEEKNLKIKEGKKFSIEQVNEAFEFQQNGHPKRKTIIEIN